MESEQSRPSASPIFGRFFSRLFSRGERPSSEETGDLAGSTPLKEIERELGELSSRADAILRDTDSGAKKTSAVSADRDEDGKKARLRQEREAARMALERDIARLHGQMGTGIDADQMSRLRSLLEAHAPEPGKTALPAIEDRIERSVLRLLFLRAKGEAWSRFETLLEGSGLCWPLPGGHPESLAPEEIDRIRERHRKEVRAAFLAASPLHTAELVRGEVGAWASSYPDRRSYLWLQTALRGVAAALCAQFFGAALEVWMWRTREAERDLLAAVEERLVALRSAVSGEVPSRSKAAKVTSGVSEICENVIPDLVWSYVAPRLSWIRAGEATPAISVLAAGLSPFDPVCGMSLTPERVAARLESEGRILYFCSDACRQRFEASPSLFPAVPIPIQKEDPNERAPNE